MRLNEKQIKILKNLVKITPNNCLVYDSDLKKIITSSSTQLLASYQVEFDKSFAFHDANHFINILSSYKNELDLNFLEHGLEIKTPSSLVFLSYSNSDIVKNKIAECGRSGFKGLVDAVEFKYKFSDTTAILTSDKMDELHKMSRILRLNVLNFKIEKDSKNLNLTISSNSVENKDTFETSIELDKVSKDEINFSTKINEINIIDENFEVSFAKETIKLTSGDITYFKPRLLEK